MKQVLLADWSNLQLISSLSIQQGAPPLHHLGKEIQAEVSGEAPRKYL